MNTPTPPVFLHPHEQAALGLWTPETNRIQTMHLTADELAALKAHGGPYVCHGMLGWVSCEPQWVNTIIYRAKPAPVTQDVVPWEAIAPKWRWAARDSNGKLYLYDEMPNSDATFSWNPPVSGQCRALYNILANLTPGTCDWRDSLQQRPQPAATGAVTEPLADGQEYWVASVSHDRWRFSCTWNGDGVDKDLLKRGLIHLTEAAAVAHAKRMTGGV